MQIDVEPNPNCDVSDQIVRTALGERRPVTAIRAEVNGRDMMCDIVGVDAGGKWVKATACKVADSSDGYAFLIQGGAWGIRMRPEIFRSEVWDLNNKNQWGEPFKLYGSEEDIIYEK